MYYEHLKHTGELPIIGINTFLDPNTTSEDYQPPEMNTSFQQKKKKKIKYKDSKIFKNREQAIVALEELRQITISEENIFESLMNVTRFASLGQITNTLYSVGGEYERCLE